MVTKHDLLAYLAEAGEADAAETASALGVPYTTGAMALLRAVRQHLATRVIDAYRGLYTYQLTEHGHARLAFFEGQRPSTARHPAASVPSRHPRPRQGEPPMKRKKLHNGPHYCPACFIELDLTAEESLKCDQCGGPLAEGTLDEVWSDDDDEEEEDNG